MSEPHILLVEDDENDELLTLRALHKSATHCRVDVVRDGVSALDYLFARGDYATRDARALPQVVLLDLNLPRLDGLGVLRQIRSAEQTKTLPVVILTASTEERDRFTGYHHGANSYVIKPVEPEPFAEAVRQLGRYWLAVNEPAA